MNVEQIDAILNSGDFWMAGLISETVISPEYRAYDAFHEYTEDKLRIQTLEQSERVISIKFGDLGPDTHINATTEKIGDNFEITLNNNFWNDMTQVDDFYVAGEINKQVEDRILICYPSMEFPHPIEFVPFVGTAYSLKDTRKQFNSGQINFSDAMISYDCALAGLINYFAGLAGIAYQTTYNYARDSKLFYQLALTNGYDFR